MKTLAFLIVVMMTSVGMRGAFAQGNSVQGSVLASPGGQFVFGQMSGSGQDQYMLDTRTGQLWKLTGDTRPGTLALVPAPYQAPDAKPTVLPPDVEKPKTPIRF